MKHKKRITIKLGVILYQCFLEKLGYIGWKKILKIIRHDVKDKFDAKLPSVYVEESYSLKPNELWSCFCEKNFIPCIIDYPNDIELLTYSIEGSIFSLIISSHEDFKKSLRWKNLLVQDYFTGFVAGLTYDVLENSAPMLLFSRKAYFFDTVKILKRNNAVLIQNYTGIAEKLSHFGTVGKPIPMNCYNEIAWIYQRLFKQNKYEGLRHKILSWIGKLKQVPLYWHVVLFVHIVYVQFLLYWILFVNKQKNFDFFSRILGYLNLY